MKKVVSLCIILAIAFTSLNAFAGGGGASQGKESIFQTCSDGISKMGDESKPADKKSATCLFQKSYDQIEKTPVEKTQSLRGNPEELARRRGQ